MTTKVEAEIKQITLLPLMGGKMIRNLSFSQGYLTVYGAPLLRVGFVDILCVEYATAADS